MALREVEDDGTLWFFSKKDSRKAKELIINPQVLVTFADPKKQLFVTIAGRAEIMAERRKVEVMWSEVYCAWFPDGARDDNVVLIRVDAERAGEIGKVEAM